MPVNPYNIPVKLPETIEESRKKEQPGYDDKNK